ncbi:MAG: hypothetical protein QXX30_01255 [Candidatus Aenigmatarchaeota archaeon]
MEENSKNEEFELIPVTPLRRLEKRIDELEKKFGTGNIELYREIVSIVRMNQEIVDALIKANDALRIELSKLPIKIEELTKKIEELIDLIRAAGEEEEKSLEMKPLIDKIEKLAEINNKILETNESLLSLMEEVSKKLSKPQLPPQIPRPPLPVK